MAICADVLEKEQLMKRFQQTFLLKIGLRNMQNYKNHAQYYIPHHFLFYPIVLLFFAYALRMAFINEGDGLLWGFIAALFLLIGWLSFMLRQHYALTLQNRIVVVEMRFRYYVLTGQRLELLEERLSFGQLAALRFASDEELPILVERALAEQLSADQIKKEIKKWQPDHSRV